MRFLEVYIRTFHNAHDCADFIWCSILLHSYNSIFPFARPTASVPNFRPFELLPLAVSAPESKMIRPLRSRGSGRGGKASALIAEGVKSTNRHLCIESFCLSFESIVAWWASPAYDFVWLDVLRPFGQSVSPGLQLQHWTCCVSDSSLLWEKNKLKILHSHYGFISFFFPVTLHSNDPDLFSSTSLICVF